MVDEGLTRLAASARRAAEPFGQFPCRRHMGHRCRLVVWALVLGAFVTGCVTPMAAKADAPAAAASWRTSSICADAAPNKLVPCLSPQHSPRR
ncbi:hypothetical protein ACOZ38_38635 [Sphaerisporangium viridialbum]|uniref:hypothetical protein n=1 Tax=Sphaerisporangium viridialbum TaxID=46189 RepID=UPI003C71AB56